MAQNDSSKTIIIIAILALLAVIAFAVMNAPDRRSPGEKMGDAVSSLSDGVENAGRQLQDRTPGEKMGDAIEDAGDRVERAVE